MYLPIFIRVIRRCSNYILILDLTPGFNGLSKNNCKTRLETFKFWDLVRLIQEVLRYEITLTDIARIGNQQSAA